MFNIRKRAWIGLLAVCVFGCSSSTVGNEADTSDKELSITPPEGSVNVKVMTSEKIAVPIIIPRTFAPTLSDLTVDHVTDMGGGKFQADFHITSDIDAVGYWLLGKPEYVNLGGPITFPPAPRPEPVLRIPSAADVMANGVQVQMTGGQMFNGTLPGDSPVVLKPEQEYQLTFVAVNSSDKSKQSDVVTMTFVTPEATPTLSTLTVSRITADSAAFRVISDINATGYWMVLPTNGFPMPQKVTAQQIIDQGTKQGNFGMMTGGTAFTGKLSGLLPGTQYALYFVATNGDAQSDIVSARFTTAAAKLLNLSELTIVEIGTSMVGFSITSDADAAGYWLVLPAMDPSPVEKQIVRDGESGSMNAGTPFRAKVADLLPNTAYVLYFFAVNSTSQSKIISVPFTTTTAAAPKLSALKVGKVTATAAAFNVTSDINATGYWMVLPAIGLFPIITAEQIIKQSNSGAMTGGTAFTGRLSGLLSGTQYTLYFVATNGDAQSDIVSATFTTLAAGR